MPSAEGGCELAVTCGNHLEEVHGAHAVTSLTRPFAMCTALACGASCSMPVKMCPLIKTDLQCNYRAMIRQICCIKPENVATTDSSHLLAKLELEDIDLILRERRPRWFDKEEHSSDAVSTAFYIQVDGRWGQGSPR